MIAYTTGEIPKTGEKVSIPPYVITIKKVSATKIEEIILSISENE